MAVFISHSKKDLKFAHAISAELRNRGVETWLDADAIRPGDPWADRIEAALRAATGMVVLITPETSETQSQWFEIGAAIGRSLETEDYRIVPVLVAGASLADAPSHLRRLRSLDLSFETDPKALAEKVADALTGAATALA